MHQAEILIAGLLVAVAVLSALARRLAIPYPIVLVLGGALFGFVPGVPTVHLNPDVVLVVFLPPLVYGAAFVAGGFSTSHAGLKFVADAAGGVVSGLAIGWLIAEIRARTEDTPTSITISLFSGYASFIPANALGASGVLAAVTTGIYMGIRGPSIISARTRLQGFFVWEMLDFILNASLFVLVGLQLRTVVNQLGG